MCIFVLPWLAILVAVSLAPLNLKYEFGLKGSFHYAAHFAAFVLTGFIFCWKPVTFRSKLAWSLAACCTAFILEVLEAIFYHNGIEWLDVCTGCVAVAVALVSITILQGSHLPARFVRK